MDADVASSETGEPIRERYFEVRPSMGLNLGVSLGGGGRIRASYEPRLRTLTSHSQLRETSHFVDAESLLALRAGRLEEFIDMRADAMNIWDRKEFELEQQDSRGSDSGTA